MPTFTPKVLAEGQLASSKSTLYTVPASTKAYVRLIRLFNTNAAQNTVNIYVNPTQAVSRQISIAILTQNEHQLVLDDGETIELPAGAQIEGSATNAAQVDFLVAGVEES